MKLAVKTRDIVGKKVKSLRRNGLVPAIVYGRHIDQPAKISCVKNDLLKVYKTSGYTTPVELTGDIDQLVLIHSFQLNPVSDEIMTADFLAVSRTEKVTAHVPLLIVGESPIEKLNQWRLQLVKDTVEVSAFPQDLPSQIEIDATDIRSVNDVLFIKDLPVSKKVEIVEDIELPVVTVAILSDQTEDGTGETTITAPEASSETQSSEASPETTQTEEKSE